MKVSIRIAGNDAKLTAEGMKFSPINLDDGHIISSALFAEAVKGLPIYRAAKLGLTYAKRVGASVSAFLEKATDNELSEAADEADKAAKAEAAKALTEAAQCERGERAAKALAEAAKAKALAEAAKAKAKG